MIGDWFRSNRKKVLVHSLILGGFLLYLFFLSETLFDRFETIPGESSRRQLSLPSVTDDIRYSFDRIQILKPAIEMDGWAFNEGQNPEGSRTYIAMKSDKKTYLFETSMKLRTDVTSHFKALNLNLDWSGFMALIPKRKIESGEYNIGLYITNGEIQSLQYIDRVIVKSKGEVKLTHLTSRLQDIPLPIETDEIQCNIDSLKETMVEEEEIVEIIGWAFIEGHAIEDGQTYLVLKSNDENYIWDTFVRRRPDVDTAFAERGLNLNNSGFEAKIPKKAIKNGAYALGIYIKKGGIEALQYTRKTITLGK